MGGWLLASGAGAFWLGILIAGISERGHRQAASVQLPMAGVAWILVGVWLLSSGRRDRPRESGESLRAPVRRQVVALCLALAGFAALGGGWFSFREARTRASPLVAAAGRGVHIDGSLASDPEAHGPGWSASLHASSLQPRTGDLAVEWKVHDLLWIEGRGRPPPAARGDRVALDGIPALPEGDFGGYLRHRGYTATVDVDRFIRAGPPSNPLLRAANGLRSAFRSALADVFPPREAGLVLGLVLGDTSRLDPGVEDQFRATGLSHLTAVSGENLAMFLAPVLGLAVLLGARRRARLLTGAGAILFFVLLTGGEPSVLRAAAMASIALIGVFLGRPRSAPALMGGALLALLANDPTLVYSIGFQLSVAATAGMMSMAGPVAARLGFLPEGLSLAVGATLGAQAGVTPLLLYHFGVVPTVTLPANVLAFPAVGPGMLLGLLAAALALLWLPAGGFVAWVARLPLGYLEGLAARLARSPLPSVTSDGLGLAGLFGGLAGVALLAWWIRSGRGIGRHAAVAIGLLIPAFVWAGAVRAGPPSSLTVTFFDVGQGDAALVRSPGGATILIDGGPDQDLVAAKLAALGVRRLDLLVATHAHADHVTGLPAVLARVPAALIVDPGCASDAPYYRDFLKAVRQDGAPFRHLPPGTELRLGGVRLEILGPARCFSGTNSDPNNDSVVLRLTDGPASVLFTGDVEQPAQQDLLAGEAGHLSALVLKVPHHGGATNLDEFLADVHARVAVVSVGPNRYGHPVPAVLSRLAADGMRVFRTDRFGDVTVTFQGDEVVVATRGPPPVPP